MGDIVAYCITYSKQRNKYVKFYEYIRLPVISFFFFFLFLLLVGMLWPDGAAWLHNKLLLFRATVSVSAINDITDSLQDKTEFISDFTDVIRKLVP